MPDFLIRSFEKEYLDKDNIPQQELYQNLRELQFINTFLGGHDVTLIGLKHMYKKLAAHTQITLADIGCGGGDTLIAMAKWARKNNLKVQFYGIDMKQDCINYAKNACKKYPEIQFICADYNIVNQQFDIVTSALFCHHLNDAELQQYIHWCSTHARKAWLINDLHRHPLAYYSIMWITKLFSKSYLVKNDAPLSVLRGFTHSELAAAANDNDEGKVQILWLWAFRWLVIKYIHE
ncbi:MAG: methyltransferase domain-containing protein [Cytophagales bacterium]|nr:methyltransferase domain-containing protein [Cytophagales bacterium]